MYSYWPYWEGYPQRPDPSDTGGGGLSVDEALARRVAEALLRAPLVDSGHLVVDVQNGVAMLAGSLQTQEACDAAAEQALATPGVRDVLNQLTVSSSRGRKKRGR